MKSFNAHVKRLLFERQYFTKNFQLFSNMINQFKDQLDELKTVSDGEEFYLDFSDDNTVVVRLYKTAPSSVDDIEERAANAIFSPKDDAIFVFLDNLFSDMKKSQLLKYSKTFPKKLRNVLFHELSHAYEYLVRDIGNGATVLNYTSQDDKRIKSPEIQYINNLSELNAYFHQWISAELQDNKSVRNFIRKGQVNTAVDLIVQKIKQEPYFEFIFDKNKKWFFKNIYTTIDNLFADPK